MSAKLKARIAVVSAVLVTTILSLAGVAGAQSSGQGNHIVIGIGNGRGNGGTGNGLGNGQGNVVCINGTCTQ